MSLILSGTDGLSDIDGTAATPAIRGTDANTGIFFPAADTIAFAEGGAEIARFDSSGNLGLGTTSPVAKLQTNSTDGTIAIFRTTSGANNGRLNIDISDSAATAGFAVGGNSTFPAMTFSNGGAERMRIDSSGNVGIGTASPSTKLHVVSSSGENKIISEATAASQQASLSLVVQAATPGQTVIYMGKTGATTNGQVGYDPNTNAMYFYTSNSERMRIDSSGNLLFNSGYGSVATAYGCRAWVNFNGTGTVAIRASGNVSSLTDDGVGKYSVNFSTSMPDANYAAVVTAEESGAIATSSGNNLFQQTAGVGRIGIYVGTGSSGYDPEQVNYVVLR